MNNYRYMLKKGYKKAFTLVEIMVGILIFSIVIIGGFKAYSGVLVGKIKLIEGTDIQKEAFYFSEKFFEEIKKGGTIDYEEYFNRTVVGTTNTSSGHYIDSTGFGNYGKFGGNNNNNVGTSGYGDNFYYCRSGDGSTNKMGSDGCVYNNILNTVNSQSNAPQRYLQYALQFIDYNSNYDADGLLLGDEDGDGNIIGDDDDEYLGQGPEAFSGSEVKEIYLISADKKNRTLFRWNIMEDDGNPDTCNVATGEHCRGTIEFLKLEGRDWGFNHSTSGGLGIYDGIVDTWLIHKDFSGKTNATPANSIVAGGSSTSDNWQELFGDNINVSNVKFFAYPNKDLSLAWKDATEELNIAPYIRIQMTLSPSYNARKGIKGEIPKVNINTTISLTDIYSR